MRKTYIYLITNPKGKKYIGSTFDLKDRVYRYKTSRNPKQVKIYNSIKKYGWDNHSFEVIYECCADDRNYYEAYYGMKHNCIGEDGLNLILPKVNEVYVCMSEETKKKIGDFNRGKTISDEQKRICAENFRKYVKENGHPMKCRSPWNKGKEHLKGEKNPMFGVRRSVEWRAKHSERMTKLNKSGADHPRSKIVLDKQTGVFYFTAKEVSVLYGIKYSTLKEAIQKQKGRFIYV